MKEITQQAYTPSKVMVTEHQEVSLVELGPILKHYAEIMGFIDEGSLWDWYSKHRPKEPLPEGQFEFAKRKEEFSTRLSDLYEGNISESYPLRCLQKLLRTFNDPDIETDMPSLMAEWLEATSDDSPLIQLSISSDSSFSPPSFGSEQKGKSATYKNATIRLLGFECAFVTVELGGNSSPITTCEHLSKQFSEETNTGKTSLPPHTHPHIHPGDELILVLKGSMYVRLDNSGMFTILNKGDYVHFNSEIPHSLWNLEREPSEALIVRFFQLDRQGTRGKQRNVLDQIRERLDELRALYTDEIKLEGEDLQENIALKGATGQKLLALWDKIHAWVLDRTRPPSDRLRTPEVPRRVMDYVGLSSFLTNFFTQEYPEDQTAKDTGKREAELKLRDWYRQYTIQEQDWKARVEFMNRLRLYLRECFGNQAELIEQYLTGVSFGEHKDDIADLADLARELGIPRILLDVYLAPPVLRAIVVRGASNTDNHYGFDYVAAPDPGGNHARNAKYWIPARTLVNSDMSITLLANGGVKPGSQSFTDWNQHPGFEVIVPLSGTARVEFQHWEPQEAKICKCDQTQILAYRSSWSHRVHLGQEAQVLILRFNIVDQWAIESFNAFNSRDDLKPVDEGTSKSDDNPLDGIVTNKSKAKPSKRDSRMLFIATLTNHHKYENGGCDYTNPISLGELANFAGFSKPTASAFMKKEFGSYKIYESFCSDSRIADSLKLLNDEITPKMFGRTPLNEGNHESNK